MSWEKDKDGCPLVAPQERREVPMNMEPKGEEGPDASSLRPVSSLRSHFESIGKSKEPSPVQPPSRNETPSPRPPPVPDTRPSRSVVPVQDAGKLKLQLPTTDEPLSRPLSRQFANPPPISPKPIRPPALLIDPPQSPPKEKEFPMSLGNTGAHLAPELPKSPVSPAAVLPQPLRRSSRPNTPVPELRPTLRPSNSKPPSPPPPRRSAELKRDREARQSPTLPPPINRAEKPINRLSAFLHNAPKLEAKPQITANRSPFHSPPSSSSSPDTEEPPPVLPTRPARPNNQNLGPTRTLTFPVEFEPPPVHHTVASKRRDQENGQTKPSLRPQLTGDRGTIPARQQTLGNTASAKVPVNLSNKPPPRPSRIGTTGTDVVVDASLTSTATPPSKRVVSTPTPQFAPPPSRSQARSMTVDRTSDRTPIEFREPAKRLAPPEKSAQRTDVPGSSAAGPTQTANLYPDTTRVNRRSPLLKQGIHEIYTKYDSRIVAVCGQFVCTTGQLTRVWSLLDGELVMSFAHGEGVKATSVAFKPALDARGEGSRIWIGNNLGEIMEADIASQSIVGDKTNAHGRYEVIKIFRHVNEMWTLDESGTLHVWGPDSEGLPNLTNGPHQTYRLPKGQTFSMKAGAELWHATGKEVRVFAPTSTGESQVQVLMRPLVSEGAGEVTSGTTIKSQPDKVFIGHVDGKVSIYSQKDFTCLGVVAISTYKINTLAGVGRYLWAGYNTGKICVYDVDQTPWVVKKDWQAHDNPTIKILADPASCYKLDRLQVVSLGADNMIRTWDGWLQDDFLENEMKSLETQFCQFEDIKLLALTWNAGASTPSSLRYSESDAGFIQNLLQTSDCPDILVFGFQELVDLEDKAATAKRLFKSSKKKDSTDQERMSHQYRDWRDCLVRSIDDYMPAGQLYHLLHTATLVGLFTCIFVKSTVRDRIRNLHSAQVKRGMGGLHGNKGAIVVRFMVGDTSLCFINCHLAAGQTQANHRHNDIAAIMESSILPAERDPSVRLDSYIGGGDGSMILDHELCLLNGDLNYRIDTMSRDTVVLAVKQNNLPKLLERDQLLVARRRNPAFKLRAFEEMPIQFAPTYKYDVGTDNYDTSEKRRSPAWCDRLLHRGSGRIQQLDYRRHEVRVSDHRPVTGRFKFTIKTISPKKRTLAWADCQQRFDDLREREANEEKLYYLTNILGYDAATSKGLLRESAAKKVHRSPSRHGE